MALDQNLLGANVRDGKLGDQDAAAPINDPAEHLLHRDLSILVRATPPTRIGGGGSSFAATNRTRSTPGERSPLGAGRHYGVAPVGEPETRCQRAGLLP